ncbi:hypothetical protein ACFUJY_22540 [Streptomyces sp. NPDC057249]|uniref:hypothetical protein n=1 Tax=Streptomyces sp. NPDC057249 TaxID=3346067 RepID=UPI003624C7B5
MVFENEAGQSMTPPRARIWGRQGITPVVRVRGRGSGRVSMAGMTCYKPGERSRLIYAIRECRGRKDEPKGFGWKDYRGLIIRAHIELAAADLSQVTRAVKSKLKMLQYRPQVH